MKRRYRVTLYSGGVDLSLAGRPERVRREAGAGWLAGWWLAGWLADWLVGTRLGTKLGTRLGKRLGKRHRGKLGKRYGKSWLRFPLTIIAPNEM